MACAALLVAYTLAKPREYSAHASFLPQLKSPRANATAIASQLGIDVQGSSPGQSPTFFSDLLTSRTILKAVIDSGYACGDATAARRCSLVDYLAPGDGNLSVRREEAVDELIRRISASTVVKTGVVQFSVRMPSPTAATQVAERLFNEVQEFNLGSRQSQAGAERRFMQRQLEEATSRLHKAEALLENFEQRNRDLRSSPELVTRHERLARDVAFQQQEMLSYRKSLEDVRLEEVRDTPVIVEVERPELPVRPEPRSLLAKTVAALVFGTALGIFLAFVLEAVRRANEVNPTQYAELRELRRQAWLELRRPRLLFRSAGSTALEERDIK